MFLQLFVTHLCAARNRARSGEESIRTVNQRCLLRMSCSLASILARLKAQMQHRTKEFAAQEKG